jgi:hypothetical protein
MPKMLDDMRLLRSGEIAPPPIATAQQRDRTYAIITLVVLAVLLYSLVGGYL